MDLDEDARPTGSDPTSNDLSDETQDFRLLQAFTLKSDHPTLPRRGEKDFEPHGTRAQDAALTGARQAMHDALAMSRAHRPGTRPVCDFDPVTGTRVVRKVISGHFRTAGKGDQHGKVHLLPEEALYLLERGSLELRLKASSQTGIEGPEGGEGKEGNEDDGLVLGVQSAYAMLVEQEGLTLERFQVYAGLKRSGYIVMRTRGWENRDSERAGGSLCGEADRPQEYLSWLRSLLASATTLGPRSMVTVGLYRNYGDIYAQLTKIQRIRPASYNQAAAPHSPSAQSSVGICYNVWKPNPAFKKSAPGVPDFQVAVISADAQSNQILAPAQLDDLLATVDPSPPPPDMEKQLYKRLRHGEKHLILAIVDQGVVSYLRLADTDFGKERLYLIQRPPKSGKKKSGGGGGIGKGSAARK